MTVLMIAITVITVVSLSFAMVMLFSMPGTNPSATVDTWQPQQGQYVDYKLYANGSYVGTQHWIVVSSDAGTYSMNITDVEGGETSQITMRPNCTQAAGAYLDVTCLPSGYDLTYLGNVTIDTSYGARSCAHYHVDYMMGMMPMTMDLFVHKNVVVLEETGMMGTTTAQVLSETNIDVITNG